MIEQSISQKYANYFKVATRLTLTLKRPFPNYLQPLYQTEAWCATFHVRIILICMRMERHIDMKGSASGLALKMRAKAFRKWPIVLDTGKPPSKLRVQ